MTKTDNSEIEITLRGFPESLVGLIKDLLNDKNYTKKHDATVEASKALKTKFKKENTK